MNKCTDSGWHCLPSQVYFYLERAIRVGQITLIVLSWTVMKLNVSLCESCFSYGSPQLWECSSSEALTESLGTFMPSGWIFLQYEAAESSVQPPGSSLLLRFASFLYCDLYKSATTTEGRQHRPGAPFSLPPFPPGCWLIFRLQSCEIARSSAQLLSLSALYDWGNTQCLEGESSSEYLTHFCAFPFSPWPRPPSPGCTESSPAL